MSWVNDTMLAVLAGILEVPPLGAAWAKLVKPKQDELKLDIAKTLQERLRKQLQPVDDLSNAVEKVLNQEWPAGNRSEPVLELKEAYLVYCGTRGIEPRKYE